MEGTFFRKLFTFQLRTRNPFYLSLMFLFGVIPFSILATLLVYLIIGKSLVPPNHDWLRTVIYPGFFMLATGMLTINFVLSVLEIARIIPGHSQRPLHTGSKKDQKPSRHRKDYR